MKLDYINLADRNLDLSKDPTHLAHGTITNSLHNNAELLEPGAGLSERFNPIGTPNSYAELDVSPIGANPLKILCNPLHLAHETITNPLHNNAELLEPGAALSECFNPIGIPNSYTKMDVLPIGDDVHTIFHDPLEGLDPLTRDLIVKATSPECVKSKHEKFIWEHRVINDYGDIGKESGVPHCSTKSHEYTMGLGIGHIKLQKTGERVTGYNNFNDTVDSLLPDWMKPIG